MNGSSSPVGVLRSMRPPNDDGMPVAVVTGAGRGIGAALATALSERGHHVLVTDIDPDAARRTADGLPGPAGSMALDVRDPAAHRAVAAAADEVGDVTVWVNNAGILSTAAAWDATDVEVEATFAINTLGVVHGSRAAVEVMRRGDVLNIVSLSALGPTPGLATYGASKAAALSYSQALDIELASVRRPVRVRALNPDVVDTEMVRSVADRASSALLFSGPRLLSIDEVVAAAMALLGSGRSMRTMPVGRALLQRTSALLPTISRVATPLVVRAGERRRLKR